MKKAIFIQLLNWVRDRPNFKTKLKIVVLVGVAGLVVVGLLVVWAGSWAIGLASQSLNAAVIQQQLTNVDKVIEAIPAPTKPGCWEKAQAFFSVELWLSQPRSDNFKALRDACFESTLSDCKGPTCEPTKEQNDGGVAI